MAYPDEFMSALASVASLKFGCITSGVIATSVAKLSSNQVQANLRDATLGKRLLNVHDSVYEHAPSENSYS